MPSLSVIMIVKDEADWLPQCLQSVQPIADEIVVADTGSADETAAIAESLGARVIAVPWTNDFSAARNATIAAARGDWLLHMDADEALDAAGARAIRAIVDRDTRSDAVELILANYCNDIHAWRWTPVDPADPMARGFAGCLPVGLLRLFRGDRGFQYREAVHENITSSVLEKNGVIRKTDILIHHYGYECGPEKRKRKARLYLELAREKRRQSPQNLKCLLDVAEQAMACDEVAEAEDACRDALAIDPGHVETATVLASILLGREEVDAAYELLAPFDRNGEAPAHLVVVLGVIAGYRGEWDEAEGRLRALTAPPRPAPLATLCLARILDYRGRNTAAADLLASLAAAFPNLDEATSRLESHRLRRAGEQAFLDGDTRQGLALLVRALELDPEDALTHNDVGVVLNQVGEPARARASFERALKLAPALDDARENLACLDGPPRP